MRWIVAIVGLGVAVSVPARSTPSANLVNPSNLPVSGSYVPDSVPVDSAPALSLTDLPDAPDPGLADNPVPSDQSTQNARPDDPHIVQHPKVDPNVPVDANGVPIPLERQQPQRILGFMPNFRSVSGGAKPHPPGWKYNFVIATHQAVDYSSFIFLGLTSLSAKGIDEHPVLGKGPSGLWAYTWRGFLDKTDGNILAHGSCPACSMKTRATTQWATSAAYSFANCTSSAARV